MQGVETMTRFGLFAALVAVGVYGGTLLKSEPPKMSASNAPQITAAINHGDAAVSPVRWGRFGGWGGYYSPYYGGYGYYGPAYGGYYAARPYYGGYGYGYGSPYYSWWW
jgi:hypothetical protein